MIADSGSSRNPKATSIVGLTGLREGRGAAFVVAFFKFGVLDELDFWAGTLGLVLFAAMEIIIFSWIYGIRRGWEGLTHMKPFAQLDPDFLRPLDRINTRGIDRSGGTILHTSRTNPGRVEVGDLPAFLRDRYGAGAATGTVDCTPHVLAAIQTAAAAIPASG